MKIQQLPTVAPHDTPQDYSCASCGQEIPTSIYIDKNGNQQCFYCNTNSK